MSDIKENNFWCDTSETWRYPEHLRRWQSHSVEHWALLLCTRGSGRLEIEKQIFDFNYRDIFLIEPGIPHTFAAIENWELHWVHFVIPLDILEILNWPELLPGVRKAALSVTEYSRIHIALQEIYHLYMSRPDNWYQFAHALLTAALLRIDNMHPAADTRQAPWLQKAQEALRAVPSISVDDIAALCCLSRSTFYEEFHRLTGYTPAQYRDQIRLRNAEQLLLRTNQPVGQIAEAAGFNSIYYFSLRFKERCGMSPRQYRLKNKADQR